MILLLDAGNSRYKWAELKDSGLSDIHAHFYERGKEADSVIANLNSIENPKRILVSSVLDGQFEEQLSSWAKDCFAVTAEFVRAQNAMHGVRLSYSDIASFGVDRYVSLVAAHQLYPNMDCIIVDCGTAVTIDALSASGDHLGGVILPGLDLMRRSLLQDTAGIHNLKETQVDLFAHQTDVAVNSGVTFTVVAAIDHIVTKMQKSLQQPVMHLLSGGGAENLREHLETRFEFVRTLCLQGLAVIAKR